METDTQRKNANQSEELAARLRQREIQDCLLFGVSASPVLSSPVLSSPVLSSPVYTPWKTPSTSNAPPAK